jgi:hypothetical protein
MKQPLWIVALAVCLAAACTGGLALRGASEREGLGTVWGETRESRVHWVSFERDDPTRPAAVATLYYDDRAGVRAMAGWAPPGRWAGNDDGWDGGALRVRLIDAQGMPLPVVTRDGRLYVEGRRGQRYTIEIENRSAGRVEAVTTVDGLDVLNGKHGSPANPGYVLRPGQVFQLDGFRQSADEVAAFRFGDVGDSYAAQMGDDRNVGVIGVAFFVERGAPPPWFDRDAIRRSGADPFPGRFAQPPPDAW